MRVLPVKIFGLGNPGQSSPPVSWRRELLFFFSLIIYHFYCRYPPPIRSNERDPGHGAVTAVNKKGESRSSRAVRCPPGCVSRVLSHLQGEGGTGVPPRSPPPCSRFAGQEERGGFRRSGYTGQPCPPPPSSPGPGSGRGAGRPPMPCRVGSASLTPPGTPPRPWGGKGQEDPRRAPMASSPEGEGERLYRHEARA